MTTSTPPKQRGLIILHYSEGELQLMIDDLDLRMLTSEDSGDKGYSHVKDLFEEYLEKELLL